MDEPNEHITLELTACCVHSVSVDTLASNLFSFLCPIDKQRGGSACLVSLLDFTFLFTLNTQRTHNIDQRKT